MRPATRNRGKGFLNRGAPRAGSAKTGLQGREIARRIGGGRRSLAMAEVEKTLGVARVRL
jgi:hypothetical protein